MKSEQVDLDQFRKGSLTKVAKKPDQWSNHTIYVSGHIFWIMVGSANLAEGTRVQLGPQQHPIFFFFFNHLWLVFAVCRHIFIQDFYNRDQPKSDSAENYKSKLYNLLNKDLT